MTTMNPFDLKTALLARHAQHVVLVHFPIALFITGVAFDVLALWKKSRTLAAAAYYNLLGAAISAVPIDPKSFPSALVRFLSQGRC